MEPTRIALAFLCLVLPATADEPVGATVGATLATDGDRIRQFAFDGDDATAFVSASDASADDAFTLTFDRPVALKSVAVLTGRRDGEAIADPLDAGVLEVAPDGVEFAELTTFHDGEARADGDGGRVRALRIRPTKDLDHLLAIREIRVESDPPVGPFAYPVEFAIDVSDAPELRDWADKVARECTRVYPMLNRELASEGYRPATLIRLALKSDYKGVAAAGGGRIVGSVKYFKDHPDDVGALVHETTHIIQRYRSRNNPGWLVEGVADYLRFFKYEPGKIGPINADRARYDRSYRVTAAFLAYLAEKYDQDIVKTFNRMMREGTYREEAFEELTGKPVKELDEEWRASLKKKTD